MMNYIITTRSSSHFAAAIISSHADYTHHFASKTYLLLQHINSFPCAQCITTTCLRLLKHHFCFKITAVHCFRSATIGTPGKAHAIFLHHVSLCKNKWRAGFKPSKPARIAIALCWASSYLRFRRLNDGFMFYHGIFAKIIVESTKYKFTLLGIKKNPWMKVGSCIFL